MIWPAILILALVTLQRVGELWLSARNTRHLLDRGAREHSPGHYPLIVAVHAGWLAALWWLAPGRPIDPALLFAYAVVQLGRIWVLASLGDRWTTRILVLPGKPLVARGPYRWVKHPNYLVVVVEIALLPLVFGLWIVALVFTLLNAAVLTVRLRAENAALANATHGV